MNTNGNHIEFGATETDAPLRSATWWLRVSLLLVVLTLVLLGAASCGGSSESEESGEAAGDSGSTAVATAVATMPPARFTAVAQQALLATQIVSGTLDSDATPEPPGEAEEEDAASEELSRGAFIYENRDCGDCHGDQGQGVDAKGSALAGTTLTAQEFDNILRTADSGELGPDHLYGPSAISPGGMEVLHAWLQSLTAE